DNSLQQGHAVLRSSNPTQPLLIGLAVAGQTTEQPQVIIFEVQNTTAEQLNYHLRQLQLLADTPAVYQQTRAGIEELGKRADLTQTLELLLLLNQQEKFIAAAMTVVNETVSRFRCSRVSLGWQVDGYIRLQSISHMEQFEPKMEIVNQLEAAMEEASDQDEEIFFPAVLADGPINRDHVSYAKDQQVGQLLSLPLRAAGQVVGVLSCERDQTPFSEVEVRSLRILCDQISSRLAVLKKADRWLGAKLKESLKATFTTLLGPEKTLIKLTGLLVFGLLLSSVLVKLPYRIEAPFILRSKDVRQITAPFPGYIDQVQTDIGQRVEKGNPLLTLDNSDLLLEEAEAVTNRVRYLREAEKARAKNALIEMKIAQAQAEQAQAQLELIQHRLNRAQLRSPINGIVVEGDFSERLGTPVDKGDVLFKVARHEKLYVEIRVTEEDIQELSAGQTGEMAFVSQPRHKYPLQIQQIDPLASAEESGNIFFVRSEIFTTAESWWRPGMSGIAKIAVGERPLLWIFSHRTVNFLRLLIWW
ncbi:MAG: hypothetical protein DRH07_06010, partial [Deltaproteobacteria bacterium]